MKKTTGTTKKYGKPYDKKNQLRHGDIRLIEKATGRSYVNVIQQLDGNRDMTEDVKAAADKLVENNQKLIDSINNISVD